MRRELLGDLFIVWPTLAICANAAIGGHARNRTLVQIIQLGNLQQCKLVVLVVARESF